MQLIGGIEFDRDKSDKHLITSNFEKRIQLPGIILVKPV